MTLSAVNATDDGLDDDEFISDFDSGSVDMSKDKVGLMSLNLEDSSNSSNDVKDIYISPSGDDTNTGESESSQLKTINASLSKVNASDIATVHLAKGIYSEDGDSMIAIDLAHTVYGGSLTFIGEGYNETIIDGLEINKLFTIGADSAVTFKNISFINAKDQYGAITNDGYLTIVDCVFENDVATSYGGAIYTPSNFANATLDVTGTVFDKCGAQYGGGAVCIYGSASFKDSKFLECKETYAGSWYYGGAIYIDCYAAQKYLNVLNCEFVGASAGQAGAIYARGYQEKLPVTVKNNKFTDCKASSNYDVTNLINSIVDWSNNTIVGSSDSRAPICSYDGNSFSNLTITFINEETITLNQPQISLTAVVTDDMGNRITGGKVLFYFNETQITNGAYNEGTVSANGVASISVTKLLDNGEYVVSGNYTGSDNLTHTIKTGNAVVDIERTPVDLYVSVADGDDETGDGSQSNPFKTIKKAIDTGFKSTIDVKVHIAAGTYSGTGNTGLSVSNLGKVTLIGEGNNMTILDGLNTASKMMSFSQYTSADIRNISFMNLAKSTSFWSTNTGLSNANSDTTISIEDCVFENLITGLSVTNATIKNTKFINATATVIHSTIDNSEFVNCEALALNLGTSNVTNTLFKNNLANAITASQRVSFFEGISYAIVNCTFDNNKGVNGSAITFPTGSMTSGDRNAIISNCNFTNNEAQDFGGAISVDPSMNITIKDNKFESNSAKIGGAISLGSTSSMLNIKGVGAQFINNTFVDNEASEEANDIYAFSGRFNAIVTFANLTTDKLADYFYVNVTDDMGNPVSGGIIKYYLDDLFVGSSNVVNGTSTFNYVGFIDGVHNLTGVYSLQDDETVTTNPATVTVNIKESVPSITYYVGPEGSDESGNGSEDNPFKTIKHAYEEASSQTTNIRIELLEGNITGEGNVHFEIFGTINVTINGRGINKTFIDASNITHKAEFSILVNPGGQNFVLSNLTFANGVAKYNQSNSSNWANNIIISEGDNAYVENVLFEKNNGNGGGCISNFGTLTVVDSEFFNNGDSLNASAIDNYGHLEINGSKFILNHAKIATVYNHNDCTMLLNNCYFEDDLRTGYMSYFYRLKNEGYAEVKDTEFAVTGRNQSEILEVIGTGNMGFGSNNVNDRDNPLVSIGFSNNKTMIFDNVTYIAHPDGVKFNGAKNTQQVWGANGALLFLAGDFTIKNSRFENMPLVSISNGGYKVVDPETGLNVSYGGFTIENSVFENISGMTISAAGPTTKIVNHFLIKDSLILFNDNFTEKFNVTWMSGSEGDLEFENNWFGNNDPIYFNKTSNSHENCSSWLILSLEPTEAGNASQGFKLAFKSASIEKEVDNETNETVKNLVISDYDGEMFAREFLFETEDGTITPASGEITNSVDISFESDSIGEKTFKVTVDNQTLEYNVTLYEDCLINVGYKNITYGENAEISVTLTDLDGEIIEETIQMQIVDGDEYELHGGDDSIELEELNAGNYTIVLSYGGSETYLPTNITIVLEVAPKETVLAVSAEKIEYGKDLELVISLTDDDGNPIDANVTITVDGKDYPVEVIGGETKKLISVLVPKDYTIEAEFEGLDNYAASQDTFNVTVNKAALSLTAEVVGDNIIASLSGENGPIAGETICANINGKNVTAKTDSEGKATIPVGELSPATYSVDVTLVDSDNYKADKTAVKVVIKPYDTQIEAKDVVIDLGSGSLTAKLTGNGNLVEGKTISLKVGDANLTAVTGKDGIAKFDLSAIPAGNYAGLLVFDGDDFYANSSAQVNLAVNKLNATLTAKAGNDKINVTLKDGDNAISGKVINVDVAGKSFNLTTDKNGFAELDLSDLPSGNYTATVKVAADDKYNAIDQKVSASVSPKKPTRTAQDLQKLIDDAAPGSTVDLGNYDYVNISDVNITKDITLVGNNTTVSSAEDGKPVFNIPAKSAGGPNDVTIKGIEFIANNGDVLVKATADNGTSPKSIDTAAIDISGNTISTADGVVPESVTVLELDSERGILAPTNPISVANNTIESGVKTFEFEVTGLTNKTSAEIPEGGNIPERQATVIQYQDMVTTAVNTAIEGRVGKYFEVNLTDANGNPLANKAVQIGFNGKIYNRTTNATGGVSLQINLAKKGTYTFAISFLGDDNYNASFEVSKITVNTQKTKLTTANKSYKASAKTKTLTATLKSAEYNKAISGKTVTFTVNGKSFTAKTNSKGVASVKVSLSAKRTYSFTAKFAADDRYTASSVKGKVTIK